MLIYLNGFDDERRRIAEERIRLALGNANGGLEVKAGLLLPSEQGFVAIVDGTDQELGGPKEKFAVVDSIFDQIATLAGKDAVQCRLAKGTFSRSRNAQ